MTQQIGGFHTSINPQKYGEMLQQKPIQSIPMRWQIQKSGTSPLKLEDQSNNLTLTFENVILTKNNSDVLIHCTNTILLKTTNQQNAQ